jgi:branched-chain amino acid transport system permease protein
VPFWISAFLGAGFTAGFAVLIGIPALRIRGLFLAVTTFAFGLAVTAVLFNERYFGWLVPKDIARPRFFFLDFEDEKSMYYLCVGALVLAVVFVSNLRRSRFGRVLIALRENENNIQAFGINLVRTKLLAFAVSGGLAGFAGAILAVQQRGLTVDLFGAQRSIDIFLYAVLGGVSSVAGSLIGSLYYNLVTFFNLQNPVLDLMLKGSGTFFVLLLLFVAPGGVISLVNRMRDGVLRIIAQRRQIVVPSLFADYDPEALERRLIPLADSSLSEGLAALPVDQRYTYPSELYAGSGYRIIDRLGPAKQTKEASALTAASRAFEDTDLAGALQIPSETGAPTS